MDGRPRRIRRSRAPARAAGWCLAMFLCGCAGTQGRGFDRSRELSVDLQNQLDRANAQVARAEADFQKAQADLARLEQQLRGHQDVAQILEERVQNLRRENDRMAEELAGVVLSAGARKDSAKGVLTMVSSSTGVAYNLPVGVSKSLADWAAKSKEATYDPSKHVCRFSSDWLFVDDADRLRPDAEPALRQLASLLNDEKAAPLNLLIVGHTSALAPVRRDLLAIHPTDWHLAAHQAIAVQQFLEESGVSPTRIGVISYASHQPLVEGADDVARRKNARVEIYLLPPEISSE